MRNGWIYQDGVRMTSRSKTTSSYSIHVYEYHPTAPGGRADAFAMQEYAGVTVSGCQNQMEVIIYTNALSQAERQQVCQYLMKKWTGLDAPGLDLRAGSRFEDDAALGTLTLAEDETREIEFEGTGLAGIDDVAGAGTLVKTGPAKVYVDGIAGASLDVRAGEVEIRSALVKVADIPAGEFVHLDAADTNNMTLVEEQYVDGLTSDGKTNWVTRLGVRHWFGKDTASPVLAQERATDGRYRAPYLAYPAALGGRPVVDYGVYTNTAPATGLYSEGLFQDFAYQSTASDDDMKYTMLYTNTFSVGSVFMMIGSRNGGGVPLGGYYVSPWRDASADPSRPFFSGNALKGCREGGNWLNGKQVKFTETGLSGGYDVVSFRNILGGKVEFQSLMMANARSCVGGGELGEVIIYEKPLSPFSHDLVDIYLNQKWFGRTARLFTPAVVGSLSVAAGATVRITGGEPLTMASISGAGTVVGDVAFAADAVWNVPIRADGTIEAVVVTGAADLSAGGTVNLVGDIRTLKTGLHQLISAASATLGGVWTVRYTGISNRQYRIRVRDSAVCLDIQNSGTILIFR